MKKHVPYWSLEYVKVGDILCYKKSFRGVIRRISDNGNNMVTYVHVEESPFSSEVGDEVRLTWTKGGDLGPWWIEETSKMKIEISKNYKI